MQDCDHFVCNTITCRHYQIIKQVQYCRSHQPKPSSDENSTSVKLDLICHYGLLIFIMTIKFFTDYVKIIFIHLLNIMNNVDQNVAVVPSPAVASVLGILEMFTSHPILVL